MFDYEFDENGKRVYKNSGESVGRPIIEVDEELLMKLAEIQCSYKEIAYILDISVDTLKRRYNTQLEKGRAVGNWRLRRSMWKNAIDNEHAIMQIFLSKNLLGYRDVPESDTRDETAPLPWTQPVAATEAETETVTDTALNMDKSQ